MLKATSTLASAKLATIFISIIRTKILAIILGPAGMGVINAITQSVDLARVVFSCGIDTATVRRIACSTGRDQQLAYRTASKAAVILGAFAAITISCISPFLAHHIFGDIGKYWWFVSGGLSLLFTPLLGVELSYLQGIKQSKSLAACQIIASVIGAILTIILVLVWGRTGAIFALFPVVAVSLAVHHHFVKKFNRVEEPLKSNNFPSEFWNLLKLGSAFAINSVWLTASGWLNIFFLTRHFGPNDAPFQIGLQGAAGMLSNFYIGIIISAMSSEFYPNLIEAAPEKGRFNELLNQQTRLSMAIGVPFSAALMVAAPFVLQLLYSKEFVAASDLIRWMLVGMSIRFISCPIGFSLLAIGSARLIAICELGMGFMVITLSAIMIHYFGLSGIGIALLISNVTYLLVASAIMRSKGVKWTRSTIKIILVTFSMLGGCLWILFRMPSPASLVLGAVLAAILFTYHIVILKRDAQLNFGSILRRIIKQK